MITATICSTVIECYQARVIAPVNHALAKDLARSREYRMGMLDGFAHLELRTALPPLRYQLGSAQADAYFAGIDRGQALWRQTHPSPRISSIHTHKEQS